PAVMWPSAETRRPGLYLVTAGPTASMVPTNSCPVTMPTGMRDAAHWSHSQMWRSGAQIPAFLTRVRTSRGPGVGGGGAGGGACGVEGELGPGVVFGEGAHRVCGGGHDDDWALLEGGHGLESISRRRFCPCWYCGRVGGGDQIPVRSREWPASRSLV